MPSTAARAASQSSSKKPKDPTLRCDICQMKRFKKITTLLTCRVCHIHVHRECYHGVCGASVPPPTPALPDSSFECLACRAVGMMIKGRRRKGAKEITTKTIRQISRPTECCLCSVKGLHAMHPLYDHSGTKGRQIILPAHKELPERLAWVHSLCAYVVCFLPATSGCVYGCNRRGQYLDEEGKFTSLDPGADDQLSTNSEWEEQFDDDDDDEDDLDTIYHFGYCLPTVEGTTNQWTKQIKKFQKELKCTICGLSDTSSKSYRIPVQCRANEDGEHLDFRETHTEMAPDEFCTQAMHVGCAMWGIDSYPPDLRRVYYYPGNHLDKIFSEPVAEVYCIAHAEDARKKAGPKPAGDSNVPSQSRCHTTPPADVADGGRKRQATNSPPKQNKQSTMVSTKAVSTAASSRKRKTSIDQTHPHAQRTRDESHSSSKMPMKQQKRAPKSTPRKTPSTVTVGAALDINAELSPTIPPRQSVQSPDGVPLKNGRSKAALSRGDSARALSTRQAREVARSGHSRSPLSSTAKQSNEAASRQAAASTRQGPDSSSSLMNALIRRTSSTESQPKCTALKAQFSTSFSRSGNEAQTSVNYRGVSSPSTSPNSGRPVTSTPLGTQLPKLPYPVARAGTVDGNSQVITQHSQPPVSGSRQALHGKRNRDSELLPREDAIPLSKDKNKRLKKSAMERHTHLARPAAEPERGTTAQTSLSPSSKPKETAPIDLPSLPMLPTVNVGAEARQNGKSKRKAGNEGQRDTSTAAVPVDHADGDVGTYDDNARDADLDDNGGEMGLCNSPEPNEVSQEDAQEDVPRASPGRWDHLFVGPHYTGMFDFGEWDTFQKH